MKKQDPVLNGGPVFTYRSVIKLPAVMPFCRPLFRYAITPLC